MACFACVVLALSRASAFGQGHGAPQVYVAVVEEHNVSPTVRLVGTVRSRLRSVVAAEVEGLVAVLPIDDGQQVRKGDLLCKLRDEPRELAFQVAKARFEELAAALAEARAQLDKAEFEKKRIAELWEEQRSTEKEHHDALAEHRAATSRLNRAEHALAAQKGLVDLMADDLSRTEIRSPCDGYVVERFTEIGAWVEKGGPVAELIDLSVARVRVDVPEAIVAFCEIGRDASVNVEALKKTFSGKIARVIPDADQRARTFPVDIDVPNATDELKAGMFVRASVPSGPGGKQLLVPKDSAVLRGTQMFVYVVRKLEKGQAALALPVEIIAEPAGKLADRLAIKAEGIAVGDQVVVRGNEYMVGPGPIPVTAVLTSPASPAAPQQVASPATTQPAGNG